jgi:hypothetical protein
MSLIDGIDQSEIVYHKEGEIDYKIYPTGLPIITFALAFAVGTGFESIFVRNYLLGIGVKFLLLRIFSIYSNRNGIIKKRESWLIF